MDLQKFFSENPVVALAFSGGVDSSYLLYAATKWGLRVRAYYVRTAFQPEFEYQDALRLAKELHAELDVISMDILANPAIAANPSNRCYYCKKAIFSAISHKAQDDGFPVLIDGTNASDSVTDRPGMQALQELHVRSPLRECGLTKSEIRGLSKSAGLFTWDKPAYACLATRIPTGTSITRSALERTEQAEKYLFSLGFTDFRVRNLGEYARLQLQSTDFPKLEANRREINHMLKQWYSGVLVDLEERV